MSQDPSAQDHGISCEDPNYEYLPRRSGVIQSLFGGYLHKTVDRGTGRRDCYNLHLSRAAAEELIDQVYPYLRMKAGQANCLRLFWALRKKFAYPKHPGLNGSRPSSKEYLDLQEACYRQNKALNKRGVDAEAANERN